MVSPDECNRGDRAPGRRLTEDPRIPGQRASPAPAAPPGPSRRAALWAGLVLTAAATVTSGAFLLEARDLHLPRCSEPYDAAIYPWNLFWCQEAFGAEDGDLLFTRRLFHPAGEGLALYTPTYLYGLLSVPLQLVSDDPRILNVAVALLLWASSVATAWLAYALARRFGLGAGGAVVMALLCVVASGRLMNAARLNLFCTEFLLLFLLAALVFWQRGGRWRALAMGTAAALLLLQSQPLFFQGALAVLLFALGALACSFGRDRLRRRVGGALLAAVPFALLAGRFLVAMLAELQHSPGLAQGARLIEAGSLDAAALFLPHDGDLLYGGLLGARPASFFEHYGAARSSVSHFPGFAWIALLGAAVAGTGRRQALPALLFAAGAWLLALGPAIHLLGEPTGVPGPSWLLSWIPGVQLEKSPERLVLLVQLGLALAAGIGFDRLVVGRRKRTVSLAVVLVCLALVELGETLPLRSIEPRRTIPDEVIALAREPGDFAVLDLPFDYAGHPSHRVTATAMALGAFHHRPIFFGLYPRASRREQYRVLAQLELFHDIESIAARAQSNGPPLPPVDVTVRRDELAALSVRHVFLHDLADAPEEVRSEVQLLHDYLRQLAPTSEQTVTLGPGYTLTLYRFGDQ